MTRAKMKNPFIEKLIKKKTFVRFEFSKRKLDLKTLQKSLRCSLVEILLFSTQHNNSENHFNEHCYLFQALIFV